MNKTNALMLMLVTAFSVPVFAQPAGYAELATSQAQANATPGIRKSPAHTTPTPTNEVSPQMQALIGGPTHHISMLIQKMPPNGKHW